MWQMGGVGPMFGQLGFFHRFAGKEYDDKRPRDRYVAESRRLLKVLDQHLANRAWMIGDERSEEHTSELQSLMRISYAVFCLKKKKNINNTRNMHYDRRY